MPDVLNLLYPSLRSFQPVFEIVPVECPDGKDQEDGSVKHEPQLLAIGIIQNYHF
jgi:hypothetical protein